MAPDLPTTIFVLLHLAEKLEKVHAHRLCHRDIKPANVLWQPSANSWTLMDFGCAAPIGVSPLRGTCMLGFQAPDRIHVPVARHVYALFPGT